MSKEEREEVLLNEDARDSSVEEQGTDVREEDGVNLPDPLEDPTELFVSGVETFHDHLHKGDDEEKDTVEEEDSKYPQKLTVEKSILDLLEDDTEVFSYVAKYADTFKVESIQKTSINKIREVLDSELYVSHIPTYRYKDVVFGYRELLEGCKAHYTVYSTEYSFTFTVPLAYRKDVNENVNEYINRLISKYPLNTVLYESYDDSVAVERYEVEIYGMLRVIIDGKEYVARLKETNPYISFYSILLYFRNRVDKGDEVITTGCLREFFDLVPV